MNSLQVRIKKRNPPLPPPLYKEEESTAHRSNQHNHTLHHYYHHTLQGIQNRYFLVLRITTCATHHPPKHLHTTLTTNVRAPANCHLQCIKNSLKKHSHLIQLGQVSCIPLIIVYVKNSLYKSFSRSFVLTHSLCNIREPVSTTAERWHCPG